MDWIDLAAAVLLLVGAVLSLASGVGLLRFPDALARMHAATKPQTLGLVSALAALALASRSWLMLLAIVPVVALQFLTTPMAAHMMGRAGYRVGNVRRDLLVRDELGDDIQRAQQRARRAEENPRRKRR